MSASLKPPEILLKEIERFAKEKNILNPKFDISSACKAGDNFLGTLYRVKIVGENNGDNTEINLIFKCLPTTGEMRHLLEMESVFLHEIMFYEKKLPMFVNLLQKYGITLENVPKYFGCHDSPGNKILIMEDLKSKGFVMRGTKMLDYPHASMAVRFLGQFHACSFGLRDKRPEEFELLRKTEEPLFSSPEQFSEQFDALLDVALEAIKDEDERYIDSVRRIKKNVVQLINEACDGKNAEPYATLNHGDMWTNNILFKYNKNQEPVDLRLLDFQLCRYSSPVMDLMYMIITCCPFDMRRKYWEQLLHEYHGSLSEYLQKMDCDVEKLFPFDALLAHLKKFGAVSVVLSLIDLHLITQEEGENSQASFSVEYVQSLTNNLKTNKLYYNMVKSALKDMADKNYI